MSNIKLFESKQIRSVWNEADSKWYFSVAGRQLKGWTNKLIWGDNKLILSSLNLYRQGWSNSRSVGPAAISSRTNGKASAPAKTAIWNSSPHRTPTPKRAATPWR